MLRAARDRVDEVAHVDQAAPVAHAREGQGQPRIGPTEQTQKVGLDLGSVHEGRSEGTRLNSSHLVISYAVFCLKKKKKAKKRNAQRAMNLRESSCT